MKSLIVLMALSTSAIVSASTINTKIDFIRACVEQIAPDARESLVLECEAKNSADQRLITKYDLSAVDFSKAQTGFQRVNNRDYYMEVATKVGGLFNKKFVLIDCRQDVRNPDRITVSNYKPISIQLENRIDTTVRVELSCRAAR